MSPRVKTVAVVLLSLLGSLVILFLFGQSSYELAGLTFGLRVLPYWQGVTKLAIPPFGEMNAKTHLTPLSLTVTLERISLEQLKKIAAGTVGQKEIFQSFEEGAQAIIRKFLARLLFLAALGGILGSLVLSGRNWKRSLLGLIIGLLVAGILIGSTLLSYNIHAFRQPKYKGMLTVAPWLMGTLEEKLTDLESFRQEIRNLASNLHHFYSKVESWSSEDIRNGTLRILQVSDIHNNPAAIDLIARVVKDFKVDFIIDAGDITDFGTPLEAELISRIQKLPVTYIFIPGNHDSPEVIARLKEIPNVRVIENGEFSWEGISLWGIADPLSITTLTAEPQDGKAALIFAQKVAKQYRSLKSKPDIVVLHEPIQANDLIGKAPLVLLGHSHKPLIKEKKKTLLVNAGTTGAAGLRTFEVKEGMPYSLKILYFQKKSKKLTAIDSITLWGLQREFILERKLVNEE